MVDQQDWISVGSKLWIEVPHPAARLWESIRQRRRGHRGSHDRVGLHDYLWFPVHESSIIGLPLKVETKGGIEYGTWPLGFKWEIVVWKRIRFDGSKLFSRIHHPWPYIGIGILSTGTSLRLLYNRQKPYLHCGSFVKVPHCLTVGLDRKALARLDQLLNLSHAEFCNFASLKPKLSKNGKGRNVDGDTTYYAMRTDPWFAVFPWNELDPPTKKTEGRRCVIPEWRYETCSTIVSASSPLYNGMVFITALLLYSELFLQMMKWSILVQYSKQTNNDEGQTGKVLNSTSSLGLNSITSRSKRNPTLDSLSISGRDLFGSLSSS